MERTEGRKLHMQCKPKLGDICPLTGKVIVKIRDLRSMENACLVYFREELEDGTRHFGSVLVTFDNGAWSEKGTAMPPKDEKLPYEVEREIESGKITHDAEHDGELVIPVHLLPYDILDCLVDWHVRFTIDYASMNRWA